VDRIAPEAIADFCRAYIRRRYGDVRAPLVVQVQFDADLEFHSIHVELIGPVVYDVTPAPSIPQISQPAPQRDDTQGEMCANIVQALAEAGRRMTGPELAAASGYEFSGRFRSALAELKRQGKVKNGHPGYELIRPED
jgi:hypothetical protein